MIKADFLITILFFASFTKSHLYHKTCVDALVAKNSVIGQRFSLHQLNELCRKEKTWRDTVSVRPHSSRPTLIPNQLAWLNQVRECDNLECICNSANLCGEPQQIVPSRQIGSSGAGANWVHQPGHRVENPGESPNSYIRPSYSRRPNRTDRNRNQKFNWGDGTSLGHRFQSDRVVAPGIQHKQPTGPVNGFKLKKAVRKEYRMLTDDERLRFQQALLKLKNDAIDGMNKYDILTVWHTPEESPGAHFGPALLPFHRELLKQFEIALRGVDHSVALPYWDSTLDQPLPNPADSILWSDLFMGTGRGEVLTGPFSNWKTIPDITMPDLSPKKKIVRDVGKADFGGLYKEGDIKIIQSKTRFRDLVYCIDPYFELVHGLVHMWIGGHMEELRTSPNDPIFFLLHAFVDLLWEDFRKNRQAPALRETEYTNQTESCSKLQLPDATMKPFKIKIRDGLSNKYTEIFYEYSPRPTCSIENVDCGSQYLFCYTKKLPSVCISKVKIDGNCTGFEQEDVCYSGQCVSGKCVPGKPQAQDTASSPTTAQVFIASTKTHALATTEATVPTETDATLKPVHPLLRIADLARTTPAAGLMDTVWFPIMVLSRRDGGIKAVRDVTILSHHRAPVGIKLFGEVASVAQVPTYTGAAYAQVVSPFASAGRSEASVIVTDEQGKECVTLCLKNNTPPWNYAPCEAKVILDSDPGKSDDIPFTPSKDQAKYLNWRGEKKLPDPFVFVCHAEIIKSQHNASTRQMVTPSPDKGEPPRPLHQGNRSSLEQHSKPGSDHFTKPDNGSITEMPWNKIPKKPPSVIQMDAPVRRHLEGIYLEGIFTFPKEVTIDQIAEPIENQRSNGGCQDLHRCCTMWANVNECMRNLQVQQSCQKSCFVCNNGKNELSDSCKDYHPKCFEWAIRGDCLKNADWMGENCNKSCRVCGRSALNCGRSPG